MIFTVYISVLGQIPDNKLSVFVTMELLYQLSYNGVVGGVGFAPTKAQGRLIYSQLRLSTSVTTLELFN